MGENERRRLSIAQELKRSADAIPRLLRKIDQVLELPDITRAQALDAELIAARIGMVFFAIKKAVVADAGYEQLVASTDRLREEITTANATLDGLIKLVAG